MEGKQAPAAANGRDLLLAHPLFQGVPREALGSALGRVVLRKVANGQVIHTPGDRNQPMYLLLRGRLRAYQLTPDGRRLVLEVIEPGGFDGVLPMLGQAGHFTEAAAESLVACLDWPLLEEFFSADRAVVRNLVEMVAARLEGREEHLESMLIRDPTRRLARQLGALAKAVGEPVGEHARALPRTITHQLLADMLGVRRETVTLHLRDLVELGAVENGRRPLRVHPGRLQTIASAVSVSRRTE